MPYTNAAPFTKTEANRPPEGVSQDDFPLRVLSDIVVIEQAIEEKSTGGIILTGGERKLPCGRVVATGPGRIYTTILDASGHNELAYFVPMRINVGDWVTFGKYQSGEPLELNGKRYIMAREGDIAAVSKDGTPITLRLAKVE